MTIQLIIDFSNRTVRQLGTRILTLGTYDGNGDALWGQITGTITNQLDLIARIGVNEVTYSEFMTLKSNSELTFPTYYKITDYATKYDQPDFDAAGVLKVSVPLKTATAEPIICLAIANNAIAKQVWSPSNPSHIIEWDADDNTTYLSATARTGRITYRRDEFGNEADFDFINTYFLRYETAPASGVFTVIDDNGEATDEFLLFAEYGIADIKNNSVITRGYTEYSIGIDLPNSIFFASTFVYNCQIAGMFANSNILAADSGGGVFFTQDIISTGTIYYFNGGEDWAVSNFINHGFVSYATIKDISTVHNTGSITGTDSANQVTIDLAEQCDITGVVGGVTTITTMQNTDVTGGITNCTFTSLLKTGIYGYIDTTTSGTWESSEVAGSIDGSTFGDVINFECYGTIVDSDFLDIGLVGVNGTIDTCTFDANFSYTQFDGIMTGKTVAVATYPTFYAAGSNRVISQATGEVYFEKFAAGAAVLTQIV